jgi:hypothetical protein
MTLQQQNTTAKMESLLIICVLVFTIYPSICNSLADEFYALFYLSLYNEVRNVPTKAELYMRRAIGTKYAQYSNDYMVSCAKVHVQIRRWL